MAEKIYEVLKDKKYTGKHKVYKAGDKFKESELMGGESHLKMALEGNKDPKIAAVIKISTAKEVKK